MMFFFGENLFSCDFVTHLIFLFQVVTSISCLALFFATWQYINVVFYARLALALKAVTMKLPSKGRPQQSVWTSANESISRSVELVGRDDNESAGSMLSVNDEKAQQRTNGATIVFDGYNGDDSVSPINSRAPLTYASAPGGITSGHNANANANIDCYSPLQSTSPRFIKQTTEEQFQHYPVHSNVIQEEGSIAPAVHSTIQTSSSSSSSSNLKCTRHHGITSVAVGDIDNDDAIDDQVGFALVSATGPNQMISVLSHDEELSNGTSAIRHHHHLGYYDKIAAQSDDTELGLGERLSTPTVLLPSFSRGKDDGNHFIQKGQSSLSDHPRGPGAVVMKSKAGEDAGKFIVEVEAEIKEEKNEEVKEVEEEVEEEEPPYSLAIMAVVALSASLQLFIQAVIFSWMELSLQVIYVENTIR
jgi:hypothetical protein